MKQVTIQCTGNALLNSPSIPLFLKNTSEFGGIVEALVYQQIKFLSGQKVHDGQNIQAARVSYTRLQKHIPTVTRNTIIKVVSALRDRGAIFVIKTKRVNLLAINDEYQFKTIKGEKGDPPMLVFPELLKQMTLLEAIALQQIHLRSSGCDGSIWMIRTCKQLQAQIFPFVSSATVSRLVASLRQKGLVFMKPYLTNEDVVVNSYRVNYKKLAELLDVPIPEAFPPKLKTFGKWVNPLEPLGQSATLT